LNEQNCKGKYKIQKLSVSAQLHSAPVCSNNRQFWCEHAVTMCS